MIQPKEAIRQMKDYVPPLEGRASKLRLDFNESTIGCSPAVIDTVRSCRPSTLSVYPEYTAFKKKAAETLGIREDNCIVTNGADEAIQLLMDTFVEQRDEVILPVPTFGMFAFYASLAQAKITEVPYEKDLAFPVERVVEQMSDDTRIVVLVDPNNPTGTPIPDEDIERVLAEARKKGILVVLDEAYQEFRKKTSLGRTREFGNLVVLRTFSKGAGLAGMRLGMAIADSAVIQWLMKVSSPYNVNALTLLAGRAALEDAGWKARYVQSVRESRGYMSQALEEMGFTVYPSEANFVLANLGDECRMLCDELAARDILIRDRSSDPLLKGCARVTVSTMDDAMVLVNEMRRIRADAAKENEKPAILFDMDGILADVSNSYREVIRRTVKYLSGSEPGEGEIQAMKQEGGFNDDWELTWGLLQRREVPKPFENVKDVFQGYYLGARYSQGIYDGLITREALLLRTPILRRLAESYTLGVVTGRPREEAEYFLSQNGITDCFSVVITKDETGALQKPCPYGLQLALARLGLQDALYIGDSPDDMVAAQKAGLRGIGVIPPYVSDRESLNEALRSKGASEVTGDINAIEDMLSQITGNRQESETTQETA